MVLLRVAFALVLLALAVAIVTAVIVPITDCEQGFTLSEDVVPYCGITRTHA
jgi:hypothetical protein